MPDYRDLDSDADTVDDATDNCLLLANADQADMDFDLVGDVCDNDRDGDTSSMMRTHVLIVLTHFRLTETMMVLATSVMMT